MSGPARRRSLCLPSDPRLSRSKSDMLHPPDTPPCVTLTPLARVNPFSQRKDLKGGKIKLFDTPSKSVISLTFTLPPPPDSCDGGETPRRHQRCHSLPCTPPPYLTSAPDTALSEEEEKRLLGQEKDLAETTPTSLGGDSGVPLSLDLMDTEKEEGEEPMDCSSSPDTQDSASSPCLNLSSPPSQFSTPLQQATPHPLSNGWGSAISNGPPCLPPLTKNTVVVSRPLGWSSAANPANAIPAKATNNNGYHSPTSNPADSSPFGSSSGHSLEQEEVISCPGCCLAGLHFPSMCLRAPPRRNPYKNLNGDHAASRGLLCPAPKALQATPPSPTSSSLEPALALPGVQT